MSLDLAALGTLAEDFLAFCAYFKILLFDWQVEAAEAVRREDGHFVYRLAGVSTPRGDGKSWIAAAAGLWRFVLGPPPQLILSTALDFEGAKVVLGHAKHMARSHRDLARTIRILTDEMTTATGSRWLIRSREHTASRGLHPDLIVYDECGWASDDSLFASLLAGQASVRDPLMLVVSTVGTKKSGPLWKIKTLWEAQKAAASVAVDENVEAS